MTTNPDGVTPILDEAQRLREELARTHNNLTMILAHAREACERLNAIEFPATRSAPSSVQGVIEKLKGYAQHKADCGLLADFPPCVCGYRRDEHPWGLAAKNERCKGYEADRKCTCGLADTLAALVERQDEGSPKEQQKGTRA